MTDAYTLVPVRAQDADQLHTLLCVPEVYRFLADGAPPPREVTEAWLQKSDADFAAHKVGLWLLRHGAELAGCVLLEVQEDTTRTELTYVLHPDHWGKGLATRMAWTVMRHAIDNGCEAIIAGADAPNTGSLAVMKRLGMQFYRTVKYPAGEGAEYIFHKTDPAPSPAPNPLHMKAFS